MICIRDAYKETKQLLGEQTGDPAAARWSQYLVECREGDTRLLFQEMTGELLALDPGEEPRDYLFRHWFLVDPDRDEFALAGWLKRRYRDFVPPRDYLNTYTIFTTMACNARCFYCYEQAWREGTMSRQTALQTAAYICRHRGGRKVYLTWFGGEPLCHTEPIDLICQELQRQNVPYQSDMITNAYLFTPDCRERAAGLWNLQKVRVTLDGTRETYRRVKNYRNNDPDPLSTVMGNLLGLLDRGIRVEIRLHVDAYNREDVRLLTDQLVRQFSGHPLVNIYPHLLYEDHDGVGVHHDEADRILLVEECRELEEILQRHGLFPCRLRANPRFHVCQADEDNLLAVLTDGTLLKCRDYLERPRVGSVWTGERPDPAQMEDWKVLAPDLEACRRCLFYPECERLKNCSEKQVCRPSGVLHKRGRLEAAIRQAFREATAPKGDDRP